MAEGRMISLSNMLTGRQQSALLALESYFLSAFLSCDNMGCDVQSQTCA